MGHFLHDITSIFIITLIIFGLYISTVLLVNFLYVVVHQAGDSHFAAAFVTESSRDLKSILFPPNCLVDFDFLQSVARFSAAFCAEVSLVFHSGALPSGFTFFFIIVSLPLFFVNNKAVDGLPLAESTSRLTILQYSRTQKIGTRFSASADFVTL